MAPAHQGQGYGSRVMPESSSDTQERFELGALSTGRNAFQGRRGWLTWRGPHHVDDQRHALYP
jgi:hypothetical protein